MKSFYYKQNGSFYFFHVSHIFIETSFDSQVYVR